MSFCLQGLTVLLTDLGSDQQIQAEQLAAKLGATLIPAVSNTLPDVLVAGRAGSLTCKVTKILSAAPLPGIVLPPSTNIACLTLQNVRQARDVPVVSPAWLEGCARAGVQASSLAPCQGTDCFNLLSSFLYAQVWGPCSMLALACLKQTLAYRLRVADTWLFLKMPV